MNSLPIICACISAGALLVAALSFGWGRKDKHADKIEEMATSLLKANMKLDSICGTTSETRVDIKSLNRDIVAIDKRVSFLEQEIKLIKEGRQ